MPQRFLRPGITNSERWNSVSFEAQSLYIRILTLVDDFGRYDARPVLVRSHAFPVSPNISVGAVESMLDELHTASLIVIYSIGGKDYLQVTQWQERARTASRFPDPPGEETQSQRSGLIYFVQAVKSKRIKIGFTRWKLENRVTQLQTGSSEKLEVLGSMPGTAAQERELHRKFEDSWHSGEWFEPCEQLLAIAAGCAQMLAPCAQVLSDRSICSPPSPSPSSLVPRHRPSSLAIVPRPSPSPAAAEGRAREDEAFDEFWEAYPRKESKGPAEKSWRLSKCTPLLPVILAAIDRYKKTAQWQDPKFIPYPSTWLNQRRWEDEPAPAKASTMPLRPEDMPRIFDPMTGAYQ